MLKHRIESALVALLYFHFALNHVDTMWRAGNVLHMLPFVLEETIIAALFLARWPSTETSTNWEEWAVALSGSFLPLLIHAGGTVSYPLLGWEVQVIGLVIVTCSVLSLNLRIGIVPANRGVQVNGMYAYIRHPMYAGHFVCMTGYAISYPSLHTAMIIVATVLCLLARMDAEESLLSHDLNYRKYLTQVPYRLIPKIY